MPENEFDIQEKETKQYISVKIGEEKFGIDIGYVDNIVRMQKITRVPKAQKYFKGIINLRGDIVPVMSARIKMGLNPALFVSLKSPHERLKIGGVEVRLREFGKQLGLHKVHPHKFRRTLATMAIDKGMPIEQLQQLLGHRKIDTTLQYAMVKQSNVKIAHRKYIG